MNIRILKLLDGAKEAKGLTVIIDVFRAFSVEAYCAHNHAEKIIPVKEIETALNYRKTHDNVVLIGERHGIKLPDFDYGNSPTQVENVDFTGKTIVHTTSSGTQGIALATGADEIITGSLVNAQAIATYIKNKDPENVSLVCMGWEGEYETDEDNLCADYIKSLIEGYEMDIHGGIEHLKKTHGARFFEPEHQDVFPQSDFYLSTALNQFDFVLKVNKNNDLNEIEVIKVG